MQIQVVWALPQCLHVHVGVSIDKLEIFVEEESDAK